MNFSARLRKAADPAFIRLKSHPFVQGIGRGDLRAEQIAHYVRQDFQYLTTYVKVFGLGISKCTTRLEMQELHKRIGFVLNEEIHPHLVLCHGAGLTYAELQKDAPLLPSAHHYASHMLSTAQAGTLGEIIAVLLPCHWTYVEIADALYEQFQPTEKHRYFQWIEFYRSEDMKENLSVSCAWLNQLAEQAGSEELERMKAAYLASCQLEIQFFEMAFSLEQWAVDTTHAI